MIDYEIITLKTFELFQFKIIRKPVAITNLLTLNFHNFENF